MTLQQLHYMITIAEAGSLNRAAEILYVAQPSLTASLRELEKELGISIFNRGSHGVTLTNDGAEFLLYARQVYSQYEALLEKFGKGGGFKRRFCVSTQHYSFAVKAFVETVKFFDTSKYEFAIRETKTRDVISDVAALRSEIGILYLSDFNRTAINKLLRGAELEFHHLINCGAYVYLSRKHPLSGKSSIRREELDNYPCLTCEQGDSGSFYYAEEIISTVDFPRVIHACDRATMLNLMVGLNGYTVCSGIICEELNGSDYAAVPFDRSDPEGNKTMEIGYITRKNTQLSDIGTLYVEKIREYLSGTDGKDGKS